MEFSKKTKPIVETNKTRNITKYHSYRIDISLQPVFQNLDFELDDHEYISQKTMIKRQNQVHYHKEKTH